MASKERITELNYGYGLDGGGYSFENAPEDTPFTGACVVLDDPDRDYLGIVDCTPDWCSHSCPVFVFAPNSGHFSEYKFPEGYTRADGDEYAKVYEGKLYGSDHTCTCHGSLVGWTGAAGEPREPLTALDVVRYIKAGIELPEDEGTQPLMFEHTGNYDDHPYPDCHRCKGEGTLGSPGGEWAVYALVPCASPCPRVAY